MPDDAGDSWELMPYRHPFNVLLGGGTNCWIPAAVASYGVVWAMASAGPISGHRNILWRPG